MRIIITGGGTGGHITPAIAIAEEIMSRDDHNEILYIGTEHGKESTIVPKHGIPFKTVCAKGLKRRISIDNIKTMYLTLKGVFQSVKHIKKFKPDCIIGTGGYVSGPVLLAGKLLNVPCYIHEQNAFPGMTNKIASKFTKKVFVSYKESLKYFSREAIYTGNPVRKSFVHGKRGFFREELQISDDEFLILSVGGSIGAYELNKTVIGFGNDISDKKNLKLVHVTGDRYYDEFKNCSKNPNFMIVSYLNDIHKYMNAADLIITRAGASTLAEVNMVGLPSIIVPSPNVSNNHQKYNGQVIVDNDAGKMILEPDLTEEKLRLAVIEVLFDKSLLYKYRMNSRNLANENAVKVIVDNILEK